MTKAEAPVAVPTLENKLGRYHLAFELATGGMATVYLAKAFGQGGFEKLVALKTIHPHLAKQTAFVNMFLDEARIASRISHPNVCPVFDFGETSGTYYLAMEYLVGESLDAVFHRLRQDEEARLSPDLPALVTRAVADACEGLHAAHELRDPSGEPLHVVHRDVSPQNVFLTYDGGIRIVDFGIASAQDRLHRTLSGSVKGTAAYMAPEQARGHDTDRKADIWALGVVLWELLTGQRLFMKATSLETMFAVVSAKISPPSDVRPDIPPELDDVVMRALARDPSERYATAREMGRDLTRAAYALGDPVGLADLAEWMERLFPVECEEKKALIASVGSELAAFSPPRAAMRDDMRSAVTAPEAPIPQRSSRSPLSDTIYDDAPYGLQTDDNPANVQTGRRRRLSSDAPRTAEEAPALEEPTLPRATASRRLVPIYVLAALAFVVIGIAFGYSTSGRSDPPQVVATEGRAANAELDHPGATAQTEEAPPTRSAASEEIPPPSDVTTRPIDSESPASGPSEAAAGTPPQDRGSEGTDVDSETDVDGEPGVGGESGSGPDERGMGRVSVGIRGGWAIVRAGRRVLGQAPRSFNLPEGDHVLTILPFGEGPPIHRRVSVRPGQTSFVTLRVE